MGETTPRYPVMEIALSLVNSTDEGDHERKKEGDIIECRRIGVGGVGRLETKTRLWLRVEGLEENEYGKFELVVVDPDEPAVYDKRRYSIHLADLKLLYPALDLSRCRDVDDIYQPFLTLDGDDYTFLTEENPFEVSGLVYDKQIGDYL